VKGIGEEIKESMANWLRNPDLRRGWNCPDEQALASFLDCACDPELRKRLEDHLSSCTYCRALVTESVKTARLENLRPVPPAVLSRVRSMGNTAPRRWRWSWLPLSMAPVGCAAVLLFAWLQAPQTLDLPRRAAPSAPAVFKSPSSGPEIVRPADVVRGSDHGLPLPTVISPAGSSVIEPDRINFRWRAVPHASYYQVRVLTAEGELLWQHDSAENHLHDDGLTLPAGRYFVLVSAIMENGRSQESSPVEFRAARKR
jgi:hypothetical protein